ncbi:ATP-binding protein [Desulfatitalea alkaliphila]|uniref:ATP-binding protein n=1 Tax=Desulfatitalea alkaliphila TaxID=2929485 RepID=A0AA41R3H2_9BACT|nr:ATP-binding protein [Desulfatitalea alkaliphila]MCJ8500096.1 ATP-binding protein [Desulfatitalea alkaliphila]
MPETLHRPEHAGASPLNMDDIRPQDYLLALLAELLPEAVPQQNSPEAHHLQARRALLAHLPSSAQPAAILAAHQTPNTGETHLLQMADAQGLGFAERIVLCLCYAVEQDAMLGRCIAYLQQPLGGSRPTLSLIDAVLGRLRPFHDDNRIAAIANGRAVALGMLQLLDETAPLPEQSVKMPAPLALSLAGKTFAWPGAATALPYAAFALPPSIQSQAQRHARALKALPDSVLVLRCASKPEAAITARTIATCCAVTPLFITDPDKALPGLGPVCRAKNLMPVFRHYCGPGETVQLPRVEGYDGPLLVMAGLEGAFESPRGNLSNWLLPRPTLAERQQLWEAHLGEPQLATTMARNHVHSTSRIIALSQLAKRECIQQQKARPGLNEIRQAAWVSDGGGLAALAQPVNTRVKDDALVVRPFTRRQLELLEKRCHIRERLGEGLGATIQARYQMGVKALFLGPSGTGKTLATGWLANRLGIPLYRVDLAAITSKYIGETEKNLAKLLGQAEQEEVLLLFDEADALFGKRTEIKDANDRFANAQTNYLLQRIETYTGVVILTSNSRARFDAAFTRRLDMMIEFPLPTPEERRALWLSHLGDGHRLSPANVNQLAVQCNLTGGHIRNVVLGAAVVAKDQERAIRFADLIAALADEYRKLGKELPPEFKGTPGS